MVDMCTKRMITELTSRLEATAQGHLSVERLQTDFLNSKLEAGASMIKPVDHEESFSAMIEWMVESGRGNRLDSFLISVTAYFKDTHRPDLTKTDTVKTTLRKMKEINPTRSLPKTTGTSELLKESLLGIPDLADTPFLAARETFTMSFEAMSGLRCGEVFGAQMGHGVMANGVKILTWKGGAYECPPGVVVDEEFVEAATESSKTKVGRCVAMVGRSKGPAAVALADALRSWWAACGFHIESRLEEGWLVEGPSFWVVQIPLMGVTVNEPKMEKLRAWLGTGPRASTVTKVTEVRKELSSELADKARVKEPDVEKMFINVLGGRKNDSSLEVARSELRELGIETELTKGPLVCKTKGKTKKGGGQDSRWYPQPLQVSSTYTFLHRAIDTAFVRLKKRDPEFEMRLGGDRETPHFAHNTWRRLAATAAQASLTAKRCEKEDVELQMGWQLRKHAKEMRLHYAERGARACRARMTEMI